MSMRVGLPSGHARAPIESMFHRLGLGPCIRTSFSLLSGDDIECVFVRDQDIPRCVESGTLDCGLTGHEWIHESGSSVISVAELICARRNLDFNRWVLAVPADSAYHAVEDLAGKVVVTELARAAAHYFRVRNISITVEISRDPMQSHLPMPGDAVLEDLKSSASLRNGDFRILATVLQSATEFIVNEQAWTDAVRHDELEGLALMLCGDLQAQERVGLMFTVRKGDLPAALRLFPPGQRPRISPTSDEVWVTVNTVIEEATAWNTMGALKAVRAENIVEFPLRKVLL